MATLEENKAQFRRTYDELFNQGNLAIAEEVVAPDFINHEVPPGLPNRGPEAMRQVVMMLRPLFPTCISRLKNLSPRETQLQGVSQ